MRIRKYESRRWRHGRGCPPLFVFTHCESDNDDTTSDNDEDKQSNRPTVQDYNKLKSENEKLTETLSKVSDKVEKFDKLEQERAERERAKVEAERVKKEGHETLLKEKDEKLKEATERLEKFERNQLETADKKYNDLPEEVRKAIEPMREKLDVADWADLVERHHEIKTKSTFADQSDNVFMRPGDKSGLKTEHEPAAKTMEIIDEIGKGDEGIKMLTSKTEVDPEKHIRVTKFTRHVRKFVKDMNPFPVQRLEVKR